MDWWLYHYFKKKKKGDKKSSITPLFVFANAQVPKPANTTSTLKLLNPISTTHHHFLSHPVTIHYLYPINLHSIMASISAAHNDPLPPSTHPLPTSMKSTLTRFLLLRVLKLPGSPPKGGEGSSALLGLWSPYSFYSLSSLYHRIPWTQTHYHQPYKP